MKKKPGRPKMAKRDLAKGWLIKWKPALLLRLKREVPKGERSQFVQNAVEKALDSQGGQA